MRPVSYAAAVALLAISVTPSDSAPFGDWRVDRVDGKPPVAGSKMTMRFDANGRVSGAASCNRFGAAFRVDGEKISFGPAMTTRMACPPKIMAQEQKFLRLLQSAASWRIDAAHLTIASGDGAAIEASATKF